MENPLRQRLAVDPDRAPRKPCQRFVSSGTGTPRRAATRPSTASPGWSARLLFIILTWLAGPLAEANTITQPLPGGLLFVLSADKPIYHQLVATTLQHLQARLGQAVTAHTLVLKAIDDTDFPPPDTQLIVAVGTRAVGALLKDPPPVPVIEVLVPEITARRLHEQNGHERTRLTLVLEQPLPRHLALIRKLLPTARNIGVLLGPGSMRDQARIEDTITRAGYRTVTGISRSTSDLGPVLDRLLRESDVILAIPDKLIFNRETLYRLLLASYRQGVPVIGFSRAFVRSGALAAVHSTADDIGQTLADLIADAAWQTTGQDAPAVVHARRFHISINQSVAGSLGLNPPDDATLTREIEQDR